LLGITSKISTRELVQSLKLPEKKARAFDPKQIRKILATVRDEA
jgi:hypothetical protein